jgi:hypothetical protein
MPMVAHQFGRELLALLSGQPPSEKHIAKIGGLALEGTETAVAPLGDVRDIEIIVADLDSCPHRSEPVVAEFFDRHHGILHAA